MIQSSEDNNEMITLISDNLVERGLIDVLKKLKKKKSESSPLLLVQEEHVQALQDSKQWSHRNQQEIRHNAPMI